MREEVAGRRVGVIGNRDRATLAHLVQEPGNALLDVGFGHMRRPLAIAIAVLMRLAAGDLIGNMPVLRMLSLEFELTLLHGLVMGRLLHGGLLCLLRMHPRPKTADIADGFLLTADGVGVDVSIAGIVGGGSGEEHGWHGGGRVVKVHAHVVVDVNAGREAAKAAVEAEVANARIVPVEHWRLAHGHIGHAAYRKSDLLLVLIVVMAWAFEVLTLLQLVERAEVVRLR